MNHLVEQHHEGQELSSLDGDTVAPVLTPQERFCLQLRRNTLEALTIPDDLLFTGSLDDIDYEDEDENFGIDFSGGFPFSLAGALIGNTSLKFLDMEMEPRLTVAGAQAMAEGIRHSAIQAMTFSSGLDLPPNEAMRLLFVQALKSIRRVVFECQLHNADVELIGESMVGNQTLKSLSLQIWDERALGLCRSLCIGILSSNVSSLHLQAAPMVLKTILEAGLMGSPHLREVRFSSALCGQPENDSKLISPLQGLIAQTTGDQSVAFRTFHVQETLELESCCVTDDEMKFLGAALGNLKVLILRRNGIGDVGVQSFLEHWETGHSNLQKLCLEDNYITGEGVCMLLAAAAIRPSLIKIHIRFNQLAIGYQALAAIASALAESHLLEFSLIVRKPPTVDNEMPGSKLWSVEDNEAAIQTHRNARQAAGRALLTAARSNYFLEQLDISAAFDVDQGIRREIRFLLGLNKGGRRLLLEQDLAHSVWCHVLAKYGNKNASFVYYYLREMAGLVSFHP